MDEGGLAPATDARPLAQVDFGDTSRLVHFRTVVALNTPAAVDASVVVHSLLGEVASVHFRFRLVAGCSTH